MSIVAGSDGSTGPFKSRTSIDTVAVSVLPNVSMTIYSNVSSPVKPVAGVYSYVPSGLMTTAPPAVVVIVTGPVATTSVAGSATVRESAGLSSLSLVNTLPETGISTSVALMSSSATGAGSIITNVIVAVSVPPFPSSMVYGTCTVPVNPGSGVKVASPVTGSTASVPCGSPVTGSTIVIGPADGSFPSTSDIVNGSPLGSVSLSSRFAVAAWPAIADARSLPASGSSFSVGSGSAATFNVTTAVSVAPLGSTIV